jgi:hypothetical protein
LDEMVNAYNYRPNRTIGVAPATVLTEADDNRVWRRVYYDSKEAQLRRADETPHKLTILLMQVTECESPSPKATLRRDTYQTGDVSRWL